MGRRERTLATLTPQQLERAKVMRSLGMRGGMDPRRIAQEMGVSEYAVRRGLGLHVPKHRYERKTPPPVPLTKEQIELIWDMRNTKIRTRRYTGSRTIAKRMGIPECQVRKVLAGVLAPKRPDSPQHFSWHRPSPKIDVPAEVVADRERALHYNRDVNQTILGDPLPWRSALGRRHDAVG